MMAAVAGVATHSAAPPSTAAEIVLRKRAEIFMS
jgi:hypothetical protein